MGRPTLFDPELIDTFYTIINNHHLMALVMTDEDLLFKLNDFLDPGKRLSMRTFQRYKHYALNLGTDEAPEDIDTIYGDLYRIIKLAQQSQKLTLLNNLMEAKGSEWHKYKWIMERKFPDWNMAQINRAHEAETKQYEQMIQQDKAFAMEAKRAEEVKVPAETKVAEEVKPQEENATKKWEWKDAFGNVLNDWNPDMTPREDELPLIPADEQRRVTRRYYEDFRGRTGDRPNHKDANIKNYWPDGYDKPVVDENNTWWSDKNNPPRWPENSVRFHSIQKLERERLEEDPNYQPIDFENDETINPKTCEG